MNEINTNEQQTATQVVRKKSAKKKVLGAAAILCALGLLGGTFAWFSKTESKDNVFSTDTFNTSLVDIYNPVPVTPGAEISKQVGAVNNGQSKVVVRIKLTEKLQTLVGDDTNGPTITKSASATAGANQVPVYYSESAWKSLAEGYTEATALSKDTLHVFTQEITNKDGKNIGTGYLAYNETKDGKQVVDYTPAKEDGQDAQVTYEFYTQNTAAAPTTVSYDSATKKITNIDSHVNLALDTDDWTYQDGYFYYNKVLTPGQRTPNLLSEVKFDNDLGNAFEGATYTLTPTLEVTQANEEAVKDIFKVAPTFNTDGTVTYAQATANEDKAANQAVAPTQENTNQVADNQNADASAQTDTKAEDKNDQSAAVQDAQDTAAADKNAAADNNNAQQTNTESVKATTDK
ncbi:MULTISPECIES: BsaA family SipW-dependent biofilm matrix protein [Caproicibacterium]|uniref:BsaA family SipW-dependent biofilm matrix protein n=1 Tax=Caproicibacterium argilliputei TaxID=3030016 RepID=A0AA97DDF2_9FIRM|nr:BsaA family SipW-dependent biofilm matrix protein [Caproicibacterium argilliputei]WOC33517.1 BsaA family SipW-dependent biofilm matrix protein [Caproicibacterium argilliputei]